MNSPFWPAAPLRFYLSFFPAFFPPFLSLFSSRSLTAQCYKRDYAVVSESKREKNKLFLLKKMIALHYALQYVT